MSLDNWQERYCVSSRRWSPSLSTWSRLHYCIVTSCCLDFRFLSNDLTLLYFYTHTTANHQSHRCILSVEGLFSLAFHYCRKLSIINEAVPYPMLLRCRVHSNGITVIISYVSVEVYCYRSILVWNMIASIYSHKTTIHSKVTHYGHNSCICMSGRRRGFYLKCHYLNKKGLSELVENVDG